MYKYFILIFVFSLLLTAQTEKYRWEETKVDYRINHPDQRVLKIKSPDIPTFLVSTAQVMYYKLFSEYDGDNCPFYPSCSSFFVDAVEQTNILQGSLIFADRFTRDTNFFKSFHSYPIHSSGKFYDPAYKYTLHSVDEIVNYEKELK